MMENLIAQYRFDDEKNPGADVGGNGFMAKACGKNPPHIGIVAGRRAAIFPGGANGTSYFELPEGIFDGVDDETGITVTAWVNFAQGTNVWERVFDFGKDNRGPYMFLTRNFRGVCFKDGDLFADPVFTYPLGEWVHVAMSVSGTKNGTFGSAGPCIYVNGDVAANGEISQTASGTYKRLREWFATFGEKGNYSHNYIGRSQFAADGDFSGAIADFCIFKRVLGADEIVDMMCETLTDEQILVPAAERYLAISQQVITEDIKLPTSLLRGRVRVEWESDRPELFDENGKIGQVKEPAVVTLTAKLRLNKELSLPSDACVKKQFTFTVMPQEIAPYSLTIHPDQPVLDISKTLYGLFYEDINNAADGGIYAEMVKNRSFEAFYFDTYDFHSGEDGRSTGRNHTPLVGWYGDLDKLAVKNAGGINEVFGQSDPDGNVTYVEAADGAVITNRGFSDTNGNFAMHFVKGERYHFTVWAKAKESAILSVRLLDADGNAVSKMEKISITGEWKKYGTGKEGQEQQEQDGAVQRDGKPEGETQTDTGREIVLVAEKDCLGQLELSFAGSAAIDMVSMFPEHVWGFGVEEGSTSAHANYLGNPNYRLRRDLVLAMKDLHPAFLRFPGGCISEGSYIWENVYDWKDSVDIVEKRKENFNVWGYMMTLGLGYMEYFQLAEDLNAMPLPVMACGVLCQARSDYANPAGGKLQEKYIGNFTDLIDFAISTDFEKNRWAMLRREMGHEAPFALHYLGVGNENWGKEFYASFEEFYGRITAYVKENYPDWELHIISTVGAQADDRAYQNGWRYLSGNLTGNGATIRFTDGVNSFPKEVEWYRSQKDFMETIVDEHYYRSNEYLFENVDRYNYYARAYKENGGIADERTSKVFVGEYASSDKNTLAGAVAEAAAMTGFERNSDVVRLAATAPLFNKVLTDGTYRWTPDCIWFDDEAVWRTPNYYVQQMFAKYLGDKLLHTEFSEYRDAKRVTLMPSGGIELLTGEADLLLKKLTVCANAGEDILFEQDFTKELDPRFVPYPHTWLEPADGGLLLKGSREVAGLYLPGDFSDCTVEAVLVRVAGEGALTLGVGVSGIGKGRSAIQYVIGDAGKTSVRVIKDGVEGYALGDFSCGRAAGNLRAALDEEVATGEEYTIRINYGGVFEAPGKAAGAKKDIAEKSTTGYGGEGYGAYRHLVCSHKVKGIKSRVLDYKLEAYNRAVFHSVTADGKKIYAKLVNADNYPKKVELVLAGDHKAKDSMAAWICLTGEEALVHEPNVNTRGAERVAPVEKDLPVKDSKLTVTLPANSVSVVMIEK